MERMKHAKRLAEDADGDYVTADRLIGNMQYYPNAMKALHDFETPQHISLLKSAEIFKIVHSESGANYAPISYSKGALIATDDFVHFIFDGGLEVHSLITSYESISNINIRKTSPRRRIEIKFGNNSSYWRMVEAKTAPDDMLDKTTQFIQTKIQEKSIFYSNVK